MIATSHPVDTACTVRPILMCLPGIAAYVGNESTSHIL
jgi:hypothetical protein